MKIKNEINSIKIENYNVQGLCDYLKEFVNTFSRYLGGEKGTVASAFMGALFLGFIYNVMVIAGVNVYFQSIVI